MLNKKALALRMTMAAVALTLVTASTAWSAKPKYVFMFVGDGLGLPQRAAAVQYLGKDLVIDSFPAQGITTTHAADRFITGSAAAATALSAGVKTNIGVVGMDADLQPVKTLAEIAKEQGKKVGIVSSVSIDHATPAAFYAHVPKRGNYYDIDLALAKSSIDYFAGGGLKDPANKRDNAKKFEGNAVELAKANGFTFATGREEFEKLTGKEGKIVAINGWLQDSGAMPYAMDTSSADISLAEFTAKGIDILDNPNGFFMMVEGGKIDWACHANDAAASIHDTIAFDDAVAVAYDFYKTHPEETLIVVTGDHETGGLTLGFAGTKYKSNYDLLSNQKISFQKFQDDVIKVAKKDGNVKFDSIKEPITDNFGLKFTGEQDDLMVLKDHELKQLKEAFERSMADDSGKSKDPATYLLYGGYDPLTISLTHIINQKAGVAWTSYKHTAVPVSTAAVGVGYERFQGMYDNTDVAKKVMEITGLVSGQKVAALKN